MRSFFILALVLFLAVGVAQANVWVDETFEDSPAFNDLDTYANDPVDPATALSFAGTLTTAQAFSGSQSFLMTAGQSIDLVTASNLGNGDLQYVQFAFNVASIPAAGTMASLVYNFYWTYGTRIDYSYFVDFVSDGVSSVQIVAGESLASPTAAVIDTVGAGTWKFITLQLQKNGGLGHNDDTLGQTDIPQGVRFYCSSSTPQLTVPTLPAPPAHTFGDLDTWSLTVNSGSLYIDEFYWEGGMTYDSTQYANRNIRNPLNGGSLDVEKWQMY